MKCAVLAIGNEILLGDTANSNAHTLSKQLSALGFSMRHHLTVADVAVDIREALDFTAPRVNMLFVTGGLGPTTDDITRTVISQWAKRELYFHQETWDLILVLFKDRDYPVHEMQKQQCYFPAGSRVLSNRAGTAPGFHLTHSGCEVYVLPGPPREIAAIWQDHLLGELSSVVPQKSRAVTRSLYCLGPGESQVASLAEPILNQSSLGYGYRACFPYVELRVEGTAEELESNNELFTELMLELSALCPVYPSGSPLVALSRLFKSLNHRIYFFEDQGHILLGQMLYNEGVDALHCHLKEFSWDPSEMLLGLGRRTDLTYKATLIYRGQRRVREIQLPRKLGPATAECMALEYALWFWLRELTGNTGTERNE